MTTKITPLTPLLRRHPRSAEHAAAVRYVGLAEQAITIAGEIENPERRRTVWQISEAWLSLAEAELSRD